MYFSAPQQLEIPYRNLFPTVQLGVRDGGVEYGHAFKVTNNDCDVNGLLSPACLMRMAQEVATCSCDAAGMDAAFFTRTHTAFLLAKVAFEWRRVPAACEHIALVTRPEKCRRGVFKRINEVYDVNGEEIGLMDSRWILVDTDEWRILRHVPESYADAPFADEVDRSLDVALPNDPQVEPVRTALARYSYCDTNHHVNNTRYADIACDALPPDALADASVRRWVLNYRREILFGQSFSLERARMADGSWYVRGTQLDDEGRKAGTKPNFEALLELAPVKWR